MENGILGNVLLVALILFVITPVVFGVVSWVWSQKFVPYQAKRGKNMRGFGQWMSEINNFVFKEDQLTLAPKASPLVQKILSFRTIHIALILLGVVGAIISGNMWFLLLLPVSFCIGVGRAIPRLKKRHTVIERIYNIANSSIKLSTNRSRAGAGDPYWKFVQGDDWITEDPPVPAQIILKFTAGGGPLEAGQQAFEKTFNKTASGTNIWVYEWDLPKDKATIKRVDLLPDMAEYPGSMGKNPTVFPVGVTSQGEASYDISVFPHVLVCGPSGTGKSVLQRNIVFHTIQHNDRWRFLGIDLKRVELTRYNKYKKTVMGIATDVEQGLEVLRYVNNEMMDRYKMMENMETPNLMELEDPPHFLLVMIDEATMFLGASGSKTDEGKAADAMKAEAADLVGKILRLGRACGVHMLIAMQRPDATVLRGEFKTNMDVRLAAGRMDSTPSSMVLDSGEAAYLPGKRGRGLIRVGGNLEEFQGYFAKQDYLDEVILANPHMEPSCVAPGGHLHEEYKKRNGGVAADIVVDAPAFNQVSENSEPVAVNSTEPQDTGSKPDKQQILVDALNKKADAKPEGEVTEKPNFFTKTKEEAAVPNLNVRPEVEPALLESDSLMDDYSDLDQVLNQNAGFVPPVAPEEVTPPAQPVSPFTAPAQESTAVTPQPALLFPSGSAPIGEAAPAFPSPAVAPSQESAPPTDTSEPPPAFPQQPVSPFKAVQSPVAPQHAVAPSQGLPARPKLPEFPK